MAQYVIDIDRINNEWFYLIDKEVWLVLKSTMKNQEVMKFIEQIIKSSIKILLNLYLGPTWGRTILLYLQ